MFKFPKNPDDQRSPIIDKPTNESINSASNGALVKSGGPNKVPPDDTIPKIRLATYDEVLDDHSPCGLFQIMLLIWMILISFLFTGNTFFMVYAAEEWEGHNICEDQLSNTTSHEDLSLVIKPLVPENETATCLSSDSFYSARHQFNMSEDEVAFVETIQMVGLFVGSLVAGQASDSFGRKYSLIFSTLGVGICGIASSLSPNVIAFGVSRFVVGIFTAGIWCVHSVYIAETVASRYRIFFIRGPHPIVFFLMGWVGRFADHWTSLSWAISSFALPAVIINILALPESPRWLIARREVEKGARTLESLGDGICCSTKTEGDEEDELGGKKSRGKVRLLIETNSVEVAEAEKRRASVVKTEDTPLKADQPLPPTSNFSYIHLFYNKESTLTLLVLVFSNFVTSAQFYGFMFHLPNLPGETYLNFEWLATVNVVVILVMVMLDVWIPICGRILFHQIGLWVPLGASVMLIVAYQTEFGIANVWLIKLFAFIGIGVADFAWGGILAMSAEAFPTETRNLGNALCQFGGNIGKILAPFIASSYYVWYPTPFIVYTVILGLNIVLGISFLTETKNRPLLDHRKSSTASTTYQSIQ